MVSRLLLLVLLVFSESVLAKRIAWLAPMKLSASGQVDYSEGNQFWRLTHAFIEDAAQDLEIDLDIYMYNRNRFEMLRLAEEIAKHPQPYDAVLFYNFQNKGVEILDIFEAAKIPVFTFITNFEISDSNLAPRRSHKYWIGQMVTDDIAAGSLLADALIQEADERYNKDKFAVVAIGGEYGHSANVDRQKGLTDQINIKQSKAYLQQYLSGSWKRSRAERLYPALKNRYREMDIVWCANDELALGVMDALKANETALIGGIDWDLEALKQIQQGRLYASVGGHFLHGGFSLVLIHDYLAGRDFNSFGNYTFKESLILLTQNDSETIGKLLEQFANKTIYQAVDFKNYSLLQATANSDYNFSIKHALKLK
ncbi:ABC transporter substrate-binding protein [Catenovulum sediminis]|uniref:ABC transporter substrate-binding protein n=1 Tax=Catenovulum sediminis TaxID=1740262 RepID=UPI00117DA2A7|nr:ABC transporter substrate-binding protein [Catenovulum sediminis]